MIKDEPIYVNGRFLGQAMTGVQKFAYAICMELAKAGEDVVFLCPQSVKEAPPFGRVKKIGELNGHFWEQISLPDYLKKHRIKTVLNLCNTAPWLYSGNIVCVHDLSFLYNRKWFSKGYATGYQFLIPKILRGAKQILTVSEFSKKEISTVYSINPDKIKVIYNGIYFKDEPQTGSESALKKGNYILFVGSVNPRKNIGILIQATNELKDEDLRLVVVGKRNKIFSKEMTGKPAKVEFLEQAGDNELQSLYKNARMLVLPSFYEGFGLPVLEALSFNCPVICSDIPVFRELFEGYVTYFDVLSKEDLKQKIKFVLHDKKPAGADTQELLRKFNYGAGAGLILDLLRNR